MDPANRYGDFYKTEQERVPGAGMTRKRKIPSEDHNHSASNEGIYEELSRLRSLVDEVDGGRAGESGKTGIDGSIMSTVFGIVLVMILSISVYAFTNLYKALVKRFSKEE